MVYFRNASLHHPLDFPQGCNCSPNEMCLQPVDGRTCNGDSGSFMGRVIGNQWQEQGIVSWGILVSELS